MVTLCLYTWTDLHTDTCKSVHVYEFCLTHEKIARIQKFGNLHLPRTKCKSHFAYMQDQRTSDTDNRSHNVSTDGFKILSRGMSSLRFF